VPQNKKKSFFRKEKDEKVLVESEKERKSF
jgi:hypothetical protein